jgi:hypothetical protein
VPSAGLMGSAISESDTRTTVDYVSAVAGPVMKNDAPKPSALRDILERHRKFYAWLADYERKSGCSIGPWSYNPAA